MKTFKQTVALLLSVFMVLLTLGAVPVMAEEKSGHTTIADGVDEVTIDGKTFAVIRDKAGLMAKITEGILSENLIFANDIDMGGECFSAAIANLQSTIDGNGFALYNFSLKNDTAGVSLFNVVRHTSAEIRNLDFGKSDQKIQVSGGGNNTSVIFGTVQGVVDDSSGGNHISNQAHGSAVLTNVNVYADVTGQSNTGLFAGYVDGNLSLTGCAAFGSVNSAGASGGMIGAVSGVNGLVEPKQTIDLENCVNGASVSGTGGALGGVIGQITACQNNKIDMTLRNVRNLAEVGSSVNAVGGLVGSVYNNGTWLGMLNCTLTGCVNSGAVTGNAHTGGLFGEIYLHQNNACFHIKLSGCRNEAVITGNASQSGGFIGFFDGGTVGTDSQKTVSASNCVNLGALKGDGGMKAGFCADFNNWKYEVRINHFLNMGEIAGNGGQTAGVIVKSDVNVCALDHCVNLGNLVDVKDTSAGIIALGNKNVTVTNSISAGKITRSGEFAENGLLGYIVGNAESIIGTEQESKGENNRHMPLGDASANSFLSSELTAWQDLAQMLNDEYTSHWGNVYFALNNAKDGLLMLPLPELVGVQETKAADGKYSIRLVAVIDSLQYSEVGFRITLQDSATGEVKKSCRTVFETMLACGENGEMTSYTAEELGGKYIYALIVDGLSDTETYVFHVTPYALDISNEETVYSGASCMVTYANGAYAGGAPVMPEN